MKILDIGDVLIVAVLKENREWGYNPAPDGTRLKVIGFNTRFRGRVGEFGHKPGEYLFNDMPITAREDDGTFVEIGAAHLRREDGTSIPWDSEGTWIGELPELPFWEGDAIRSDRELRGSNDVVITRIFYKDINTKCNDGITPYPIYTIAPTMTAGISTSARESDLSLIRRGNVWKYYHSEPLKFESVAEEAQFYDGQLGRTKEIRNDVCGYFSWTIEEAVNAVRDGKADAISVNPGLFGMKPRPNVKRFLDREVGERVREQTLLGWANFDPSKFKDEIDEALQHRKDMDALRIVTTK